MKERRFGWLIGRVEHAQQAIAPANGGAGGVDAIVPIVIDIAVALAAARGKRIEGELPEKCEGAGDSSSHSPAALLTEPFEESIGQTDGSRFGHACFMVIEAAAGHGGGRNL